MAHRHCLTPSLIPQKNSFVSCIGKITRRIVGLSWSKSKLIEAFHYTEDRLRQSLSLSEIEMILKEPGFSWINLSGLKAEEVDHVLRGLFAFHPLTIEDCRNVSKYPKTDSFPGYSFLIVLSPKTTVPVHAKIFMRELDIYLLPNAIVTFHKESLQAVQRVRDTLARDDGELLSKGPDFVLHALLDVVIDRYRTTAEVISERSRELESHLDRSGASFETLQEILDLGYSSRALRALVNRIRDILETFYQQAEHGLMRQESRVYFSDLDDHMRELSSSLALSIDRLESSHKLFLAYQGGRRNDLLTILGGLFFVVILLESLQISWFVLGASLVALLGILLSYFFWVRKS
jgi:magnesium transporter